MANLQLHKCASFNQLTLKVTAVLALSKGQSGTVMHAALFPSHAHLHSLLSISTQQFAIPTSAMPRLLFSLVKPNPWETWENLEDLMTRNGCKMTE